MTEQQFINSWYQGLSIAVVIVLIVAVLALALIVTARRILRHAVQALDLAKEIVDNTQPVWELDKTNHVALELLEGARAIEEHATQIADALGAGTRVKR